MIVSELAEKWLVDPDKDALAPKSRAAYRYDLGSFGDAPVELDAVIKASTAWTCADRTRVRRWKTLRQAVRWGTNTGLIDPETGERILTGSPSPKPVRRPPATPDNTADHIARLFHTASQTDCLLDQALVVLLYRCGLRPYEIAAAEASDLISSPRSLWTRGDRGRQIPVTEGTLRLLDRVSQTHPGTALVPNSYGDHLNPKMVWSRMKTLHRTAQLTPWTPAVVRRAIAAELLTGGWTIPQIESYLGQSVLSSRSLKPAPKLTWASTVLRLPPPPRW